jgi:hypothetical protein
MLMFFANDFIATTAQAIRRAVSACQYFGALLVGALNWEDKGMLLSPHYIHVLGQWDNISFVQQISEIANGSYKQRNPPGIYRGYVVKSLEVVLWNFYHSQDYQVRCLMAANLGDIADTTVDVYDS